MGVTCGAQEALTAREAQSLNGLSRTTVIASTAPLDCEFTRHGSITLHAAYVQAQDHGSEDPVVWWLLWDDNGYRTLRAAPACHQALGDEMCLLIQDHPGACTGMQTVLKKARDCREDEIITLLMESRRP